MVTLSFFDRPLAERSEAWLFVCGSLPQTLFTADHLLLAWLHHIVYIQQSVLVRSLKLEKEHPHCLLVEEMLTAIRTEKQMRSFVALSVNSS